MEIEFQNFKRLYLNLKKELDEAYYETMLSGYYILGKHLCKFESAFSEYCKSEYTVGVASGLDALTIALSSLHLKKGSEVIVPANTYIATFISIVKAGLVPVPVDADIKTLQINTDLIKEKITQKTAVILPVHLYYQTADMDIINEIAVNNNLQIVTDAAQGHGTRYKGRIVGSLAEIECFSFYPTKNLGAIGDAGAIVTNNNEVNLNSRILRNYGEKERYISELIGYNSRMDELQAAFLNVKLRHLDAWNERRRYIAKRYISEINSNYIKLPEVSEFSTPNWYIFPIISKKRGCIKQALERKGIKTIVHYPVPPYLQPAFRYLGFSEKSFPISYYIANTELSLPIDPYLEESEIDFIIDSINNLK